VAARRRLSGVGMAAAVAGSTSTAPSLVAWLSVDPVRRKLDFYPKAIAAKIEKSYQDRDPWNPSACVLGSDFFNATVHFHPSGSCYQTTPGMSMGRAGFKQPGYRSVKRVIKPTEGPPTVVVFSKQVHGEWRIAASESESEVKFEESVPSECLVEGAAASADATPNFRPWSGNDLSSGAWDVSVIVWQWCRGVPERQGNLMALSDEWWCPYLTLENGAIEAAFSDGHDSLELEILERRLLIKFTRGQSFALQRDERRGKERTVRRVVKTVQELKVMLDRMMTPPIDPTELSEVMPSSSIPHHFFCPITQDVMNDPVKTVDGMCYDRPAIERWFTTHSTSPLTGLPLTAKTLVPHAVLREQITKFVQQHAHLITPHPTPQSSSSDLLAAAQAQGAHAAAVTAALNALPTPSAAEAAEVAEAAASSSSASASDAPPPPAADE